MRLSIASVLGLCLTLLAGCNGPSPHFAGIAATEVTLGATRFEVRRRGTLAEAIRLTPQYAPRLGPLAGMAQLAIEQASGCAVVRLAGDAAVTVARLDCGGAVPRGVGVGAPDCHLVTGMPGARHGPDDAEFDCVVQ
ncbi:hypothetical protein [Pseudooceanicola sp.]|uniref:hypothetical protein n=1 Tax=Pseudooceanicola sp. TaxID=1914328 RepID=UPI002605ED74|nr:hypothetical protein [Pseudooceanicola sp.]MDF1857293.1 hypothetical protein [Pseudooceanicola sp.]